MLLGTANHSSCKFRKVRQNWSHNAEALNISREFAYKDKAMKKSRNSLVMYLR